MKAPGCTTGSFPIAAADHHQAAEQQLSGVNRRIYDDFMSTGAVVAGRGLSKLADGWGGDHHDGVPIWVSVAGSRAST